MKLNITKNILKIIKEAIIAIKLPYLDLQVLQSNKIQKCDYQVNGIITMAKKTGLTPLYLSNAIIKIIKKNNIFEKIEVSKIGFINIVLSKTWLEIQLNKVDIFLFFKKITLKKPRNIIIDYSSPNMAKEMHVGHLRSTIIGDAIANIFDFLGNNVIRINHIGDWGIQFGMIIAYLHLKKSKMIQKKNIKLSKIELIYQKAKKLFDEDKEFAKISCEYLIKLQNNNINCLNIWKNIVDINIKKNQKIYKLLNVSLNNENIIGESFYINMLPDIVKDLKEKKIAFKNKGATIVVLNEFRNKLGNPMGVIIQKKDGSYLYTTIDVASVKYRCKSLNADRILYFVDSRQHQHLMQVFNISLKAGYITNKVSFEHHMFGMILNELGKPFKTRSGKTIKLYDLLKEAMHRAYILIKNKNNSISRKRLLSLKKNIGIGAIKYFDLSKNRNTNYKFNWDDMLKLNGNTSPYIQYTYTRIVSIIKKSNIPIRIIKKSLILIREKQEKKLSIQLLKFQETLFIVSEKCLPNILCNYLYELSVIFSNFYEHFNILNEKKKILLSRIKLSYLTLKTLKTGLNLLGINVMNKM